MDRILIYMIPYTDSIPYIPYTDSIPYIPYTISIPYRYTVTGAAVIYIVMG